MIDVLSIDGGGIRGLIPALVLRHVEEQAGRPVADLFDLIAGTSTGDILALGLTIPEEESSAGDGSVSPRYSAEALRALYRERGDDIFDRSRWQQVTSVFGLTDEKYDHAGLVSVLEAYFGDEPMGEAVTDVMVSADDVQAREPFYFMSWRAPDDAVPMRRAALIDRLGE